MIVTRIHFDRPENEGRCGECGAEDEDLWFVYGCWFCWDCAMKAGAEDAEELEDENSTGNH